MWLQRVVSKRTISLKLKKGKRKPGPSNNIYNNELPPPTPIDGSIFGGIWGRLSSPERAIVILKNVQLYLKSYKVLIKDKADQLLMVKVICLLKLPEVGPSKAGTLLNQRLLHSVSLQTDQCRQQHLLAVF